jgi:glycosyltransferase involved in cell wall biosynthesis
MSCGCVPVATACGGPEEIINSGENGILVPTKSPSAIAEAVLKLIQDENTRTLLSKNALRRSKDFSFEKMGESFLVGITSYEETLDR